MPNKFHRELTLYDIHTIHAFTYADTAARVGASGLTAADVGKVALQVDEDSFWILLDEVGPTWKGFSTLALRAQNTGILSGGLVTIASSTTIDITAGLGVIVDYTDPAAPDLTEVSWEEQLGVAITGIANDNSTVIAFDENGQIQQTILTNFDAQKRRDQIGIGVVLHVGGNLIDVFTAPENLGYGGMAAADDFIRDIIGPCNVSGNVFGPNGVNLSIDNSGGDIFDIGKNYRTNPELPNQRTQPAAVPASFLRVYRQADPIFGMRPEAGSPFNVVNPGQWDDGSGTLQTVPTNKWTIQRIFIDPNGTILVAYGQELFNKLTDAESALGTESFQEKSPLPWCTFRCFLIVKDSATDLSEPTEAKFFAATSFRISGAGGASVNISGITLPGGADTELQFNDGGLFGGDSGLTYQKATQLLTAGGALRVEGDIGIGVAPGARKFHMQATNAVMRIDRDANSPAVQLHRFPSGFGSTPWKGFMYSVEGTGPDEGSFVIADLHQAVAGGGDRRLAILNDGTVNILGNAKIDGTVNGAAIRTSDTNNLFLGAGAAPSQGDNNIAIGIGALAAIDDPGANKNVALGVNAGLAITSASACTLVGYGAGDSITTGTQNTFFGNAAGAAVATGFGNVICGVAAGSVATGSKNVFMGRNAGPAWVSGNNNILIGDNAGGVATSGNGNIIIGEATDAPAAATSYFLSLGGLVFGDLSNGYLVVGGSLAKPTGPETLTVKGNSTFEGSVRIGSAGSPSQELQVQLSKAGTVVARVYNDDATNGVTQILCGASGGGHINFFANSSTVTVKGVPTGMAGVVADYGNNMIFAVGSGGSATEKMRLDNNGLLTLQGAFKLHDEVYFDGEMTSAQKLTACTASRITRIGNYSILIGNLICSTEGDPDCTENVIIGMNSWHGLVSSTHNVCIGASQTGRMRWGTDYNVFIGSEACGSMSLQSRHNVVVGASGVKNVENFDDNVLIGSQVARDANTVMRNIVLGKFACKVATLIEDCVIIGYQCADGMATAERSIFIGSDLNPSGNDKLDIGGFVTGDMAAGTGRFAGLDFFGDGSNNRWFGGLPWLAWAGPGAGNVFVGDHPTCTLVEGDGNLFFGANCGFGLSSVAGEHYDNIFIGRLVAANTNTGDGNILIGYAVECPTGHWLDSLNIGNLIFGEGRTAGPTRVRIGGALADSFQTDVTFEVGGTDGAFLLPRMTTTQRNALTKVNGMMIYNTTSNLCQAVENGSWINL